MLSKPDQSSVLHKIRIDLNIQLLITLNTQTTHCELLSMPTLPLRPQGVRLCVQHGLLAGTEYEEFLELVTQFLSLRTQ